LAANASRRPAGWTPPAGYTGTGAGGEHAHVNIDNGNDGFELIMVQADIDWSANHGIDGARGGRNDHPITHYHPCPLALSSIANMQFPSHQALLRDPNIWIGDTAASTHSTGNLQGMYEVVPETYAAGIQGIDGQTHKIDSSGKLQGTFHDKYGNFVATVRLESVAYSPINAFNLISIPQLLQQGWVLSGNGEFISVTSPDGVEIQFDIVVKTPKGQVYAACMKRHNELSAIGADGVETKIQPKMTINEAHAKYGHCSESLTRATAAHLKVNITRTPFHRCTACGMGKAKQKNVPKSIERLHRDICIIRKKHDSKAYVRPNWHMMVDAACGIKFSSFWNTKAEFVEPTCELIHHWIAQGIVIKNI
jgi:hypothetical protein